MKIRFAYDEGTFDRPRIGVWRYRYGEHELELKLWDAGPTYHMGRDREGYEYQLTLDGEVIFTGDDYTRSTHTDDIHEIAGEVVSLLGLRKGWDTDDEHFEDYTPEQLDFAAEFGEVLQMWSIELEEGHETGQSWRGGDPLEEEE